MSGRPVLERRALLLTDVVDSTQLVRELGDLRAAELWARHDTLARALLPQHGGLEIDKTDGFLMLFETVDQAARYAVAYHEALDTASADLGVRLAARAGIHFGDVILRTTPPEQVALGAKPLEVEGLAKPTAARVMSIATARQTLMTAEARAVLDAPELSVMSHGHWRLKGIDVPVEVFEVGAPDAPFTPPPDGAKVYRVVQRAGLWTPVQQVPTNLGPAPDAFFGRARALRELADALSNHTKLVTITGDPRIGKARLAQRYARVWLGDWPDGVWVVDARGGLGPDWPERGLVILTHADDVSVEAFAARMERNPPAAVIVTRRERLGLRGERVIPLGPLDVDAAAALFEERTRAADPGARPDPEHVRAIVDVLGGHPGDLERAGVRGRAPGRDRPFLGLRSFSASDADRFFGRESEARSLAERVRKDALVTVTGSSGSGKTSLLQAGVRRYLPEFDVRVMRPGAEPLEALVGLLDVAAPMCTGVVIAAAAAGEASLEPREIQPGPNRPLLVVVDQAEELLTLVDDPVERNQFGAALVALAALRDVRVALIVREDFFARLVDIRALKGRYHRSIEVLTRPDAEALRETLVKPAALFGHRFEPGLAERMVEEVGTEPAALALLQFCADQLWDLRDAEAATLSWAAYERVGGVTGALTVHADRIIEGFAPAERGEARRQVLRLVTTQLTKDPRARQELIDSAANKDHASRVVDQMIEARLLTAFEADDGTVMVELVHEALLRHWERLRGWLGEDEEGQRMTSSLRQAAEEWERRGRSADLLWRGSTLLQLEAWRERAAPTLTAGERAFADASTRASRARRRAFWAVGTLAVLGLVAVAISSLALWLNAEAARQEADLAAQRALAEQERALTAEQEAQQERARAETERRQAEEASALALAAREDADVQRAEAEREAENARHQEGLAETARSRAEEARLSAEAAARTVLDAQRLFAVRELEGDPARAAPFLRDVDPRTLPNRWRSAALTLVQRPLTVARARFPADARPTMASSPSGFLAVVGGPDLLVWNGLGPPQAIGVVGSDASAVAWADDGQAIAVARADGALQLFIREGPEWRTGATFVGHTRPARTLTFAPDGRRLASASSDGTVRVWPTDGGPSTLLGAGAAVWSAQFVGDGVLTAAANGEIALWDPMTGTRRWHAVGSDSREVVATAVAWDRDRQRIAGAWSDGSVRVYDGDAPAAELTGAGSYVVQALFRSPTELWTRGQAGDVNAWRQDPAGTWSRAHPPLMTSGARHLALSADGHWLAVAGHAGTVGLYELGAEGHLVDHAEMLGHDPTVDVVAVAFDARSRRLVSLGADGDARVWRARGSGLGRHLPEGNGLDVRSLAYAETGDLEVTLRDGARRVLATAPPRGGWQEATVVAGSDGSVAIALGDAPPAPLVGHAGPVYATALLPGRQIATAARDGTVRVWDLPDDDALISQLASLPIACIAAEDRQRYLGEAIATATAQERACAAQNR